MASHSNIISQLCLRSGHRSATSQNCVHQKKKVKLRTNIAFLYECLFTFSTKVVINLVKQLMLTWFTTCASGEHNMCTTGILLGPGPVHSLTGYRVAYPTPRPCMLLQCCQSFPNLKEVWSIWWCNQILWLWFWDISTLLPMLASLPLTFAPRLLTIFQWCMQKNEGAW